MPTNKDSKVKTQTQLTYRDKNLQSMLPIIRYTINTDDKDKAKEKGNSLIPHEKYGDRYELSLTKSIEVHEVL